MGPVPGTSYHRLARTTQYCWLDPLLGTVVLITSYVVVLASTRIVLAALGRASGAGWPPADPVARTALALLAVAAALPLVLLAARVTQHRQPGTLSSVAGRLRWRWLGTCALVAAAVLVGLALVAAALIGDRAEAAERTTGWPAGSVATLVVLVSWQAAAEEYLFRGWLLQAVGAYLRGPWLPIGAQAVLFAAIHGWGSAPGFAATLLFGAVTGWLAVRTGGLEAGIALHVVTNLASLLAVAATGQPAAVLTSTAAPWPTAVLDAVAVGLFAVVVSRLVGAGLIHTTARRRPGPSRPATIDTRALSQ